ncbi:MAG: peptidoglycan bridge formation glycyltransferase FemA/FemB family protein [Chloroflexi bacterium]|nr:peptidoglycan bridge formation glycyltransferase FemA/FemB family protein [Chloroflexota bacterium]
MILKPETVEDGAHWDDLLLSLPAPHLLQSWTWGELKRRFGWRASRLAWRDPAGTPVAAGQLLTRTGKLSGGLKVAYCPKGPILDWGNEDLRSAVLTALVDAARTEGALVLKIDPEIAYGTGAGEAVEAELLDSGWRPAPKQAQFRNTLLLDLLQDEEALLQGMKQKWRYNVRLATRKGVHVRRGGVEDLDLLYRMYVHTSLRDGFVIRSRDYYMQAWGTFTERGLALPLIAEVEGTPVAGQIIYRFGRTGWYLYGMSTNQHREKMPNHLLHWEAIRWAKEQGCEVYDFVGAPDELEERDPMWGVYRFKKGFGGELVRTIGEWDYALRPAAYRAYRLLMPVALSAMRVFGRRRVAREAS